MNKDYHALLTYVESLPAAKIADHLTLRTVQVSAEDALYFLGIEVPPDDIEKFWRKPPPRPDGAPRNKSNRPFGVADAKRYGQAVLSGEFELTGEPLIFGDKASVLNAQHRCSGLLWARHLWQKAYDKGTLDELYPRWADRKPYIEIVMVLGIPENNRIIDKIDTGRGRSISDVVYRGYNFSQHFNAKDRVQLSRITSQASRLVWGRMNGKTIRSTPRMDQREAMTFVNHHPGLVAMTEFIYQLDQNPDEAGCVSQLVPPSVLAGLGYLMATARTPLGKGRNNPTEIDYSLMADCKQFITSLVTGSDLQAGNPILILRNALIAMKGIAAKKDRDDRVRMVVLAWNLWSDGRRSGVSSSEIKPVPGTDPRIGGLDTAD